MAPNILSTDPEILTENGFQEEESLKMIDDENSTQNGNEICTKTEGWTKTEMKWFNALGISFFHLYFVYVCFTFNFFENLKTTAWSKYSLENFFVSLTL